MMRRRTRQVSGLFWISFALMLLPGCAPPAPSIQFTTEYQAVFMDNGQVFFGKLEQASAAYPVLRNAFFVQNQTNPETKEVKSSLVRRSVELHGPDHMVLSAKHIVVIEPVGANSRVAQVIKQAESETSNLPKQ